MFKLRKGFLTISARSGYFSFRKVSKSLRQLKTAVTKISKSLRQLKTAVTKVSKSLRQLKTAVTKISKSLRQLKTAVTKSLKILAAAKDSRYEKSQFIRILQKLSKSLRKKVLFVNI
jgi:chromosome segregation ATPase